MFSARTSSSQRSEWERTLSQVEGGGEILRRGRILKDPERLAIFPGAVSKGVDNGLEVEEEMEGQMLG